MPRPREPFLEYIDVLHGYLPLDSQYVAELPAVKNTNHLKLHPKITFFIGENGTGKSTLLEAIAVAEGFNRRRRHAEFQFRLAGLAFRSLQVDSPGPRHPRQTPQRRLLHAGGKLL